MLRKLVLMMAEASGSGWRRGPRQTERGIMWVVGGWLVGTVGVVVVVAAVGVKSFALFPLFLF